MLLPVALEPFVVLGDQLATASTASRKPCDRGACDEFRWVIRGGQGTLVHPLSSGIERPWLGGLPCPKWTTAGGATVTCTGTESVPTFVITR